MNPVTIISISSAVLAGVFAIIFFVKRNNIQKSLKEISTDKSNFENITQQANDALLVIDIVNGNIYTANPKLSELLGYPHEKLLKLTVFDLHPKEMLNRSSEVIADVWEKKGLIYTDVPFVTASGEILPVECSAKVIPYDGRPAILIYARDIRERLRMEKDIRDKNYIIEQKNKDITDSINYAQRIQQAILSDVDEIKKNLPQSFILFKPKDIVSGDFYWFTHRDSTTFIAAVDCTGHGVPGGFMSMIGNSFLNEVVNEKDILQPNLILNELREKIIRALRQKGEVMENKDGMDISLCAIKGNELLFSGANNPLWIIRNNKLQEIPADKQPIGSHPNPKPFTLNKISLEKGDSIYLFSDGYADQFGGPKRKKFMYRQLEELLLSIHEKEMNEQKKILDSTIESWKGNLDQIDDILVIGIRI
ncbi:MAG: PAS domain S-box protein [Bacteroidetes bacterium]|nr:PAS domain S-box protein [Bacteroidota bacterium]